MPYQFLMYLIFRLLLLILCVLGGAGVFNFQSVGVISVLDQCFPTCVTRIPGDRLEYDIYECINDIDNGVKQIKRFLHPLTNLYFNIQPYINNKFYPKYIFQIKLIRPLGLSVVSFDYLAKLIFNIFLAMSGVRLEDTHK